MANLSTYISQQRNGQTTFWKTTQPIGDAPDYKPKKKPKTELFLIFKSTNQPTLFSTHILSLHISTRMCKYPKPILSTCTYPR